MTKLVGFQCVTGEKLYEGLPIYRSVVVNGILLRITETWGGTTHANWAWAIEDDFDRERVPPSEEFHELEKQLKGRLAALARYRSDLLHRYLTLYASYVERSRSITT